MDIVYVKKVLADGSICPKCADVDARLETSGQRTAITQTVIADERDPDSNGMHLAAAHDVHVAPFFIVTTDAKTTVYTSYLKFSREVFGASSGSRTAEAEELLRANPALDLI